MLLHISVSVGDSIAAKYFVPAIIKIKVKRELHEFSANIRPINLVYFFSVGRFGIFDLSTGLKPPFVLLFVSLLWEKTGFHALLEQAFFLCEVNNNDFHLPSEFLDISHPERKPLQTAQSVRIRSHKYVELLLVDPADMVAISALKFRVELDYCVGASNVFLVVGIFIDTHSFAQLAPSYLRGICVLFFVGRWILVREKAHLHRIDLRCADGEQLLLPATQDYVLGHHWRPTYLVIPDILSGGPTVEVQGVEVSQSVQKLHSLVPLMANFF